MHRPYDAYEIVATLRAPNVVEALDVANQLRQQHRARARVYRLTGRLLRRRVLIEDLRAGGAT